MSDTLSNKEIDKLVKLGGDIQQDLSCDANGTGLPCRTDRLEAIKNMKNVLEIHNYEISEYDPDKGIWIEPSKSEREEGKKSKLSEWEGA